VTEDDDLHLRVAAVAWGEAALSLEYLAALSPEEMQRMLQELRVYHSLFQNLLEGSIYGQVLFRDEKPSDFLFLDVNQAFETLTGWQGITGRKASEVIPDIQVSNPEFIELFGRVALTGVSERQEMRLDTLGLWLAITAHCPEKGFFVALFENITLRKRQELLTRESETLAGKAQMAAYVAHEINGPLAGIKSAFTLLQTAIPSEHIYHPYVELVDREIDRITAIVRMMYELHRPNEPTPQNVAVATVLQDIATLLAPRFRSHRVSLRLDSGEPGLRGSLRANLLRQVLFNLLQNAIEATPPHGIVSCRARRDGANLEIQVSDRGHGIAPGIAERVWEPGFTTKRNALQGGMGLGLSTCRRLLESLQGSIHFENQPEGGCVFTVRIPLEWESSVD
jgi:signal transduction histidine kinase